MNAFTILGGLLSLRRDINNFGKVSSSLLFFTILIVLIAWWSMERCYSTILHILLILDLVLNLALDLVLICNVVIQTRVCSGSGHLIVQLA